ncbi:hypothetical protein Hgul01_03090 [Herpetosiphon gulosus]|uniref:LTD domain-containing protein n=1 Tax=Herpetosiphon gulosus TaxID=1973496 RepID=A0ABP9X1M5_9CHLR
MQRFVWLLMVLGWLWPQPMLAQTSPTQVVLNEFLAIPSSGSEFVELYNPTTTIIDLSGWAVDDIEGGSSPKILPTPTLLAPNDWLVVSLSNVLNNSGDQVRLLDPTGQIIDQHSYTSASQGLSWSRMPDGTGSWQAATTPTPASANSQTTPTSIPTNTATTVPPSTSTATNQPSPTPTPATQTATPISVPTQTPTATPNPTQIRINELMAAPSSGKEWVELYNAGDQAIDLQGWQLDDAVAGANPILLEMIIQPTSWLVISMTNVYNNSADDVRLFDSTGQLIDAFSYNTTISNRTWARIPDGTGTWATNRAPSLGQSNPADLPIVPTHARIVLNEVMSQPLTGTDWIELYNLGPESLDLQGWKIDDQLEGGGAAQTIPHSTIISPNSFLVIPVGTLLNAEIDSVHLITNQGIITDSLDYASSLSNRTWSRWPDGVGPWQAASRATPASSNRQNPSLEPHQLLINEVLAWPHTGEEFVELYNASSVAIDLSGWWLDDQANAGGTPIRIADDSLIEPRSWHTIYSSNLFNDNGDIVRLLDYRLQEYTVWSYSSALPGLSAGRWPDGGLNWHNGMRASPNYRNRELAAIPIGLVINEISPLGNEWIELYSTNAQTLDLSSWSISDDSGTTIRIAANTQISQGQFLTITLSSLLNDSGDSVELAMADGRVVDRLSYTKPLASTTWSRIPDAESWQNNAPATPNQPNRAPQPTAISAIKTPKPTSTVKPTSTPKATAKPKTAKPKPTAQPTIALQANYPSLQINEILPAPRAIDWNADGETNSSDEWIELYNPNNVQVDLTGWQLDDTADAGSRPWRFPAGMRIASQGYLVIFASQSKLSLTNTGEEVRLLQPNGVVIDQVSYAKLDYDQSWGRHPSNQQWQLFAQPSPQQANNPVQSQPTKTMSLGQAQQAPIDSQVVVEGVVSAELNLFRQRAFYLQDASAGMLVFISNNVALPQLRQGMHLQIQAKVGSYHQEPQLIVADADDLKIINNQVNLVIHRPKKLEQANLGQLVKLPLRYKQRHADSLLVEFGSQTLQVRLAQGQNLPQLPTSTQLNVTGIVSRYDDVWRLQVRHVTDLGLPQRLPATSQPNLPILWVWLIGLFGLGWLVRGYGITGGLFPKRGVLVQAKSTIAWPNAPLPTSQAYKKPRFGQRYPRSHVKAWLLRQFRCRKAYGKFRQTPAIFYRATGQSPQSWHRGGQSQCRHWLKQRRNRSAQYTVAQTQRPDQVHRE